jgi:hypothetical protein
MKLIFCPECYDLVLLKSGKRRKCGCKACSGKYLDDNLTAVVNKKAVVVGIDNNSFRNAVDTQESIRDEHDERYDFFFCGWIPTKPGEVVVVKKNKDVKNYNKSGTSVTSTMPVSAEI